MPVDTINRSRLRRFEGASPLFFNQVLDSFGGTAILSGCEFSRDGGLTLSVSSGEVMINGERMSFDGDTATLDPGSQYARKDVVYLTTEFDGLDLEVEQGATSNKLPGDADGGIEYHDPVEHDMAAIPGLPVGVAFVDEEVSSLADDDIWQWRPDADIRPGSLADVQLAYPAGGSEGVQAAVDALGGESGTVWLAGGDYDWGTSVTVTDGQHVRALAPVTATIPDDDDLTAFDAPHDGTVLSAITNDGQGNTDLDENILIEGISVEWGGDRGDVEDDRADGQYSMGIWLHNCAPSTVRNCEVHDVTRGFDNERGYGIVFSESEHCIIEECEGSGSDYEQFGFRGGANGCRVLGGRTYDVPNLSHSIQASGWPGGPADRPRNVTVSGGSHESNILFHGIRDRESDRDSDDRDHKFLVEDVDGEQIQVLDTVHDLVIRDCKGMVRISSRATSARMGHHRNIKIENLEYDGSHRRTPVEIDVQGSDPIVENVIISNVSDVSGGGDAVLRVIDRNNGASNPTIEWITIRDCTVPEAYDEVIRVEDGYTVDDVHIINNDLRDVSDIVNEVDDSTVNLGVVERNRGWDE